MGMRYERARGAEAVTDERGRPAPTMGRVTLRLPKTLVDRMRADLRRPHPFAYERIGFVSVASGEGENGELLVIAAEYHPVGDDQYVVSPGVGARIGTVAIREAVNRALTSGRGVIHVHLHDHDGVPEFSGTDIDEQPRLVESLHAVAPGRPHGMLVLSAGAANAWMWLPTTAGLVVPERLAIVGYPMVLLVGADLFNRLDGGAIPVVRSHEGPERYARQSFLGPDSQRRLATVRVAIIGYGGGGSRVGQQLAHLGVLNIRVADGDRIDDTNLNRLVGGTAADVEAKTEKGVIAKRTITAISPKADVRLHLARWQERAALFRESDIIIGCVDSFAERRELEVMARRFAIPYIDIGMDVHQVDGEPPRMAGQIILSMPGRPCMRCLGFLTEERLAAEAARYGTAGGRPQVVWPNGILASSAVGILVDLVTGWSGIRDRLVYLSYDGNVGTVVPHVRLKYLGSAPCPHFPEPDVGTPSFHSI